MTHSLQMEQEKQEMIEGMYEWKLERALDSIDELCSPVFKFGRHDSFLKLRFEVSSVDGRESRRLTIDLHTVSSFENNKFSKYIGSCFISKNGGMYSYGLDVFSRSKHNSFNLDYCTCSDVETLDTPYNEILTENTLKFRVAWGDDIDTLSSMIRQKTPSVQTNETISTNSLEKLLKDLKAFSASKTNTDSVLKVSGEEFPVHRAFLCARSPVFAAMFRHNTSESQSGVVEISDVDAVTLNSVLHYIYTGEIRGLTPETAASMYAASDMYELVEMRDDCLDFLMLNLTMENIVDAIQLTYLHEVSDLMKNAIVFIKDNSVELQENDKWKVFSKDNPVLVIKYLFMALETASTLKTENRG